MKADTRTALVLSAARAAWQRLAPLRERRRRYRRFTYGDQWGDPAVGAPAISEFEAAARAGHNPLTNNLIRRMVKAIIGRFRLERLENPDDSAQADPAGFNRLDELDARTLEEFLISGMAIHRICREKRPEGVGAWADNISPDRFFINDVRDVRGCDIELAGCLHDYSPGELLMRFSFGDPTRAARLRDLYAAASPASPLGEQTEAEGDVGSFGRARNGRCRVIEVWTLESRERLRCHDSLSATMRLLDAGELPRLRRLNGRRRRAKLPEVEWRLEVTTVWVCRCIAPDGTLLDCYDSPLPGGALPFAIKMYPLVGGEVHSLVEDVIDQQKYVNRLISMLDHIMATAAKGVLLFPRECRINGQTDDDIARAWAQPGGVLKYSAFENQMPRQVSCNATDIGAREMLQTQIQLFEDVSGVNSSLMGKSVSSAVGAARYESELRNSAVSILDLLQTFADFTARRNRLLLSANSLAVC